VAYKPTELSVLYCQFNFNANSKYSFCIALIQYTIVIIYSCSYKQLNELFHSESGTLTYLCVNRYLQSMADESYLLHILLKILIRALTSLNKT